jgi:hypothetical protein
VTGDRGTPKWLVAIGLVGGLTVFAASGCGASLHLGGNTRRVVAGSNLYFRPVLCTIPTYRANGSVSAGRTIPIDSPPSPLVCPAADAAEIGSTPPFSDAPAATVILPYYDNSLRYVLGPADIDGSAVATTSVSSSPAGGFQVELTLTHAGTAEFDQVAAARYPFYAADPSNPPYKSLEAIELNGTVVFAPVIQAQNFSGDLILDGSTAAPWTKQQADGLAQHIDLAQGQPPLPSAASSTNTTT